MKHRPIPFTGDSVRAILAGRKSQTRRIIKDANAIEDCDRLGVGCLPILGETQHTGEMKVGRKMVGAICGGEFTESDVCRLWCKHRPGDRLWVKEKWRPAFHHDLYCTVQYAADSSYRKPDFDDENRGLRFADLCDVSGDNAEPWHSPMSMWREMSRITLEVTGVRVERLQDISEADAIAEGVETHAQRYAAEYAKEGTSPPEKVHGTVPWYRYDGEPCAAVSARESYRTLWQSIHGTESWDANPWVWVIEFRRLP